MNTNILTLTDDRRDCSRRAFLKTAGVAGALFTLPFTAIAEPAREELKRPLDPQTFKKHLAGPILSP
jgi:hypothetical protein